MHSSSMVDLARVHQPPEGAKRGHSGRGGVTKRERVPAFTSKFEGRMSYSENEKKLYGGKKYHFSGPPFVLLAPQISVSPGGGGG